MHFLQSLLPYRRVCIQCHDRPDADTLAAAYAAYRYLSAQGAQVRLVYGGPDPIRKSSTRLMVEGCGIPVEHTDTLPPCDLLLLVDCQLGLGNVHPFRAEHIAIIDHHIPMVEADGPTCIRNDRQSCSTLLWEMLEEEGFPLDEALSVALLYGLFTDTACFADLYAPRDVAMRQALYRGQPLFERLAKSNMTLEELRIAGDAIQNHFYDPVRRCAVAEVLRCDQAVLGIIGDFMIQVDVVDMTFSYAQAAGGFQISVRTCREDLRADRIAHYVCRDIGSGGGHARKGGGYIQEDRCAQVFGDTPLFEVIYGRICRFLDGESEE